MKPKGRKTLAVSLEADKPYVAALGILAKERGKTVGALMRDASDSMFGADIERVSSFFAKDGNRKHQSNISIADTGPGAA